MLREARIRLPLRWGIGWKSPAWYLEFVYFSACRLRLNRKFTPYTPIIIEKRKKKNERETRGGGRELDWILARLQSDHNSHTLRMGMQNGTTTLENSLTVPYKVKHILTIWPSNSIPRSYTREIKFYIYAKTYRQIIIFKKTGRTQVSFNRWLDT